MTKSTPLLLALGLALTLSSCSLLDLSERGCIYQGILAAHCKWEHLTQEQAPPSYREMRLLCHSLSGTSCDSTNFEAPICHRSLPAGRYDLLVFNQGDNLLRAVENPSSAEILAPLREKGGETYIANEQTFVYSTLQSDVHVQAYDTTHCTCEPRPLVQQITIHLIFKGMAALPGLQTLKGELKGVTTSRWLASGKKGEGHATRAFTFLPTGDPRRFSSTFLVLGVNGRVENTLRLEAILEEDVATEAVVSLDSALDDFEADKIEITIEIDASSSLQLSVALAGWEEKGFGDIFM
jgi:hypothetical protein